MRRNENDIAKDFERFLDGFYLKYPEYKRVELYITGESFAGHYIPAIASHLFRETNYTIAGIAIGNGWVDPVYQFPAYADFAE
jgi:carboxypeptidase C (cathepsin A)